MKVFKGKGLNMLDKLNVNNVLKKVFIFLSIIFMSPSIIYLLQNNTVYYFNSSFEFLLTDNISRITQTIIFLILFICLVAVYFFIIKKHKQLFSNIKQILLFVLIITILFAIMLPFTSSDIFYYIGVGWLDSNYNQNPYYVSINEYMEINEEAQTDQLLIKGGDYWGGQTVVYGPVWELICKTFATISMGNINFALFIFKLFAVCVHILNTYLIYKICKKKIFSVIYGLNPFILIEAIANVHNDIYVVFFVLLCLYFLIRKKNLLLSIFMLALATCIKYFTILLLPFIIIYYFRKEKRLGVRFLNCVKYGLLFIIFVSIPYLIYVQDFGVLGGIFDQQAKYTKSLQTVLLLHNFPNMEMLQKILMSCFFIICVVICINAITRRNITLQYLMRRYNILLFIFTAILIANFQPWYLMWLFPTIMWQNSSTIKTIVGITITSQIANCTFLWHGENYMYSQQFVLIMIVGILISILYSLKNKKGGESLEKTSINRWK